MTHSVIGCRAAKLTGIRHKLKRCEMIEGEERLRASIYSSQFNMHSPTAGFNVAVRRYITHIPCPDIFPSHTGRIYIFIVNTLL